jgi:uncharacterized protein
MLYQLQKIDTQLDELEELQGDLPLDVSMLESKISEAEVKSTSLSDSIQETLSKRNSIDDEIATLKAKNDKYKSQLYSVKNNKEYDALTKEIDNAEIKVLELSEEMDILADTQKTTREDLEEIEKMLEKLQREYQEKQGELDNILRSTEKEEQMLREKREAILAKVNKKDLAIYSKIRKAKGTAVVSAKRGACNGCYNIVPPQRIVELRKNDKIHTCEFCGRILVSEEMAN